MPARSFQDAAHQRARTRLARAGVVGALTSLSRGLCLQPRARAGRHAAGSPASLPAWPAEAAASRADAISCRRLLVVAQVALSVLLVGSATLLLRSYYNLTHVETGFDAIERRHVSRWRSLGRGSLHGFGLLQQQLIVEPRAVAARPGGRHDELPAGNGRDAALPGHGRRADGAECRRLDDGRHPHDQRRLSSRDSRTTLAGAVVS